MDINLTAQDVAVAAKAGLRLFAKSSPVMAPLADFQELGLLQVVLGQLATGNAAIVSVVQPGPAQMPADSPPPDDGPPQKVEAPADGPPDNGNSKG